MRKLIFLLLLLLPAWSLAAKPSIDSLTRVLLKHPAADVAKVDLLNQLGYEYWIVDPAKSEKMGTEALALAGTLHYPKGAAFAHRVVGVSWWARGNYLAALRHLTKGLAGYQQLKDALGAAAMHNNIGLVYQDQRNYPAALRCFRLGDILVTSARYQDPEKGALVLHFPVPFKAEGVVIHNDWDTLGMRGTGSHTVELKRVFVPEAAVALVRPQGEFHPFWNAVLSVAMPLILSAYVGIAEKAAQLATAQARIRRTCWAKCTTNSPTRRCSGAT